MRAYFTIFICQQNMYTFKNWHVFNDLMVVHVVFSYFIHVFATHSQWFWLLHFYSTSCLPYYLIFTGFHVYITISFLQYFIFTLLFIFYGISCLLYYFIFTVFHVYFTIQFLQYFMFTLLFHCYCHFLYTHRHKPLEVSRESPVLH